MKLSVIERRALGSLVLLGLAGASVSGCSKAPPPPPPPHEQPVFADRMAVEDVIDRYYAQLNSGNHDYSAFFTPDGVLDVNGWSVTGRDQIIALYDRASGGSAAAAAAGQKPAPGAPPPGKSVMMLTNLNIAVEGETAVATMLWHSVRSQTLVSPPAITEYGLDRTELVRRDGRWLISKRLVTSYGGMPAGQLKTWSMR